MSTEEAVPTLRDRVKVFVGEISYDDAIFEDGELEAQVRVKVEMLEEEVGKVRVKEEMLEEEVGKLKKLLGSGKVSAKVKGGLASGEWAELGVEDKILESEVMSSLSATFHSLDDKKLKLCLISLSVFTDNTAIKKRPLIYWWMGEGIVETEEMGEEMFEKLLNVDGEFFIKQEGAPNSLTVYPWTRRMLLLVAQETGFLKYSSYPQLTPIDGHRRAFLRPFASDGGKQEGLATVFNINEQYLGRSLEWVSSVKRVEVLQLGRWQESVAHHIEAVNSKRLLKGLGTQKQLKYLSLRGVARIETLPASIGKLVSLKILDLRACHNLEKLPESISELKELTHLDVSECYLLESMPKGLPNLSNLQVLKGFVCSKNSCRVSALVGLKQLRKLSLRLGNQMGNEDLKCLAKFPALSILTLSWGLLSDEDPKVSFDQAVSLPDHLAKLDLRYVPFQVLPQWLQPPKLPSNLKKLYIKGGKLIGINLDDYNRIQIRTAFMWGEDPLQ